MDSTCKVISLKPWEPMFRFPGLTWKQGSASVSISNTGDIKMGASLVFNVLSEYYNQKASQSMKPFQFIFTPSKSSHTQIKICKSLVCVYAQHTNKYVSIYTQTHTHTHIHSHTYTHITLTCTHATHILSHTHIHSNTHPHTHTHVHTLAHRYL